MRSQKVNFKNAEGEQLSARLEIPAHQHPHTFALFAHCFTCNKNLTAVRNISRELTVKGFAVLRFDFTGLGESEGDFADTNFSSNVEDLTAAARYLELNHQPPALLIGHSLGGAAVIRAAHELPAVQAVATIGAPFSPQHVSHLLAEGTSEIEKRGKATVNIGGRPFTIKQQFLEDLQSQDQQGKIARLNRSLLLLHSPQDRTVEVDNAAKIYHAAKHPKSFISLDGADHLLMRKEDSRYAGEVIASWAKRYLEYQREEPLRSEKEVAVRLNAEDGFTSEVSVRHHSLTADEPAAVGGNDFGPSPYELLSAGLGACTAMTLRMYAQRKKWPLESVTVHLEQYKDHASDCENMEKPESKIDHFERVVELEGELSEEQQAKLLEIADKCPVHRTLHAPVEVKTTLK